MGKLSKIIKFYDQVKQEIVKITWPTKSELISSTIMVVVVVLFFSVVCLGVDYCINFVIQLLLKIGK